MMNVLRWLLPSLLSWIIALSGAAAVESEKVGAARLTIVADTTAIESAKPFTIGVRMELDPTWYIYWQYVGDIGTAPTVDWDLPAGFKAGPLQWPMPVAHEAPGDFLNYVYEHEVLLSATITPPAQIPPGPLALKAAVKWQMCDPHTCVPGEASLALQLAAGAARPANEELFAKWRAQLPREGGGPFTVTWDRSRADALSVRLEGIAKDYSVAFYPLPPKDVEVGHPKLGDIAENGTRTITFPISSGGAPNLAWRGVLVAAKEGAPREGWLVAAGGGASAAAATAATVENGAAADHGLAAILWSAFLGGLILNLMPCVLPVIALKIFGFVQQAGEEPRRVFRLGLAFVAGVFTFFLGLATLIAVLRANGIGLNWGFQFQNAAVLVTLIALVFVFGLNLLGVFEIALGGGAASKLSELSRREGYGGAFLHGMFTTLLGTSCTAPFLGAVLGFAFVAPAHVVFLIFTAIAAGMSLPYFLLTANPAWMRFLPKPGAWMERLKQCMGFIMLGVVVWLLGVVGQSRGVDALVAVTSFLLVLGIASWIYGAFGGRIVAWLAIIALIAGGSFIFLRGNLDAAPKAASSPEQAGKDHIAWQPWSEARVAEAVKAGQPVFIDFTADWCLNCKYNEKFVIDTEPVRAALKAKNVLTLKADFTNRDPAIAAILAKFKRAGVPVYLLYPGGDREPVVLPEILTQSGLLSELAKL
jgi:thiol:disulfide interchange protein DsbD